MTQLVIRVGSVILARLGGPFLRGPSAPRRPTAAIVSGLGVVLVALAATLADPVATVGQAAPLAADPPPPGRTAAVAQPTASGDGAASGREASGSRSVAVVGGRSGLLGALPLLPGPAPAGVLVDPVAPDRIDAGKLAAVDTLALFEPCNLSPPLSPGQLAAIDAWVRGGGKLIVWSGDRCAGKGDYAWLSAPFKTVNPGPQGSKGGRYRLIADTSLGSSVAGTSGYLDVGALGAEGDSGDSDVIVSSDPKWCALVTTRNAVGARGAVLAWAYVGRGLALFSGIDADGFGAPTIGRVWQLELAQPWDATTGAAMPDLPVGPDCPVTVASLGDGGTFDSAKEFAVDLEAVLPYFAAAWLFVALLMRNDVIVALYFVFLAVACPALLLSRAMLDLRRYAHDAAEAMLAALAYKHPDVVDRPHPETSPSRIWLVIGPLVNLILTVIAVAGEVYILRLVLALLNHSVLIDPGEVLGLAPETLQAIAFIAVIGVSAETLFELRGALPTTRPFHNLTTRDQLRLTRVVLAMIALSLVGVVLLAVCGALARLPDDYRLDDLLWTLAPIALTLAALLVTAATFLTAWAMKPAVGAFKALFWLGLEQFAAVVGALGAAITHASKYGSWVVMAVAVDLFARPFMRVWNATAAGKWSKVTIHHIPYPDLSEDVSIPLSERPPHAEPLPTRLYRVPAIPPPTPPQLPPATLPEAATPTQRANWTSVPVVHPTASGAQDAQPAPPPSKPDPLAGTVRIDENMGDEATIPTPVNGSNGC